MYNEIGLYFKLNYENASAERLAFVIHFWEVSVSTFISQTDYPDRCFTHLKPT